ncbi:MAG: hypothetical protein R3B57_12130 [Phycisphaerales bacterium]
MSGGAEMLRALGAGIRPVGGETRVPTPKASDAGFAQMLRQACDGELRTESPVAIAPGLDLSLTPAQEAALSGAADRAESAGAKHALVLLDDMTLLLDVTARQVVDTPNLASAGVLAGIDSIVRADSSEDADGRASAPRAPAGPVGNASLLQALARIDSRRSGASEQAA